MNVGPDCFPVCCMFCIPAVQCGAEIPNEGAQPVSRLTCWAPDAASSGVLTLVNPLLQGSGKLSWPDGELECSLCSSIKGAFDACQGLRLPGGALRCCCWFLTTQKRLDKSRTTTSNAKIHLYLPFIKHLLFRAVSVVWNEGGCFQILVESRRMN